MTDLAKVMEAETAEELADVIDLLRGYLTKNGQTWENVTLDRYLDALAAVLRDHRIGLLAGHDRGSVPYHVLAKLLQAAFIYE